MTPRDFDTVFAKWWAILCAEFNRSDLLDDENVVNEWRTYLAKRLTADELDEACRREWARERRYHRMPRPKEIVAAVADEIEARGFAEWVVVEDVIRDHESGTRIPHLRGDLSDRALSAIEQTGGFDRYDDVRWIGTNEPHPTDLANARAAFLRAYRELVQQDLRPRQISRARRSSDEPARIGDMLDTALPAGRAG